MLMRFAGTTLALTLLMTPLAHARRAEDRPDVGPNIVVQSAANELKAFTSADFAFLGAGFLKESFSKDDLSTMLTYPTDEVVVLNLTGEQIRQALERSVSLYPQPNPSFLQLSGLDVVFKKSGAPKSRIISITVAGAPLVESRSYSVAMPSLLAKGGLGYFKIWENTKVAKRFEGQTIESILKGKRATEGALRWTAQN